MMNTSKRLEDLKWFSAARHLTREEVWWLIEQAEKTIQYETALNEILKCDGSMAYTHAHIAAQKALKVGVYSNS